MNGDGAGGTGGGPWPPLPVLLSIADRRCLVVGGGHVATRRAGALLRSGAIVTVVAPQVGPELLDRVRARPGDDRRLTVEHRPYRSGEAAGYDLVVAATGVAEVDLAVVTDARAADVHVSSADADHPGDLLLPAVHRDGPVTVAVSTDGSAPAVAGWLRGRIAGTLGHGLPILVELVVEARGALRAAGQPTGSVDWPSLLERMAPLVDGGRVDEARAVLRAAIGAGPTGDGAGRPEDRGAGPPSGRGDG